MILTMVYKTGQIRVFEQVEEVNSRPNLKKEFELVFDVNGEMHCVGIELLDRWGLTSAMGARIIDIELTGTVAHG